ncbi:hypothetical protein [Gaetbulibacter aestuarii]|uniref:Glycerophosphoryl diester phosphodiesterase membrane domain-containing protein n=1 Tax=Gaetbulibacter aestuarii TaxID=1502358 RepID=A0ABW7MX52_9FLAO
MELYKNRSFGAMFQGTFSFLKQEGKHFFKQYFIINGIFLLILSVMGYFFSQFYTEFFKSSIGINGSGSSSFENYINDNLGSFFIFLFLFIILALISGIVAYAFPPIYFQNYLEKGSGNFDTKDLINSYKKNFGKLLIFIITGILVAILLALPVMALVFVLFITIIGIILSPLVLGGIMLFYTMALMEYLQGKRGVWDSFGYSWTLLKSNFFAAVACVGLFYLISYTIQQVLTLIPYFLGLFSIFTSTEQGQLDPGETASTMMFMIMAVFFVSFIVGSILGTVVQVNQGIIFYSLKEKNENIQTKSVIDQIGVSE